MENQLALRPATPTCEIVAHSNQMVVYSGEAGVAARNTSGAGQSGAAQNIPRIAAQAGEIARETNQSTKTYSNPQRETRQRPTAYSQPQAISTYQTSAHRHINYDSDFEFVKDMKACMATMDKCSKAVGRVMKKLRDGVCTATKKVSGPILTVTDNVDRWVQKARGVRLSTEGLTMRQLERRSATNRLKALKEKERAEKSDKQALQIKGTAQYRMVPTSKARRA